MSVKLLWYPAPDAYRLEVFIGPNTQKRRWIGTLTFTPVEAAWFRLFAIEPLLELAGDDVAEYGWLQPVVA